MCEPSAYLSFTTQAFCQSQLSFSSWFVFVMSLWAQFFSACLSLMFCKFLVGTDRFLVGAVHPLALRPG